MFLKKKVVTVKNPFSVIGPFCTCHSIWLTLASDKAVLCGNDAFAILVFSTKTQTFCEKGFLFNKIVSKLKYWKRSKSPVIVTLKQADISNGELFWKSLV